MVVCYMDDGVIQLISEDADVKALQEAFSGEYELAKNFREDQGEYIFYFGKNLTVDLEQEKDYQSYAVFEGKAYSIHGDEIYRSKEEIDLSVLSKHRKDNPDKE